MNIINIIRIDQDNADLEAASILASTASNRGWRRRWWWWASNCLSAVCLMRLARAIRGPSSQPQDERDFLCSAGLRHRHPTTEPTKAQSEGPATLRRRIAPLNPDLMNLLKVSVVNDSYCVLIRCDINGERTLIHGMTISQSTPGKVNQGTTRAVREATERRKNDTLRHHPISISPDLLCQLIITQES